MAKTNEKAYAKKFKNHKVVILGDDGTVSEHQVFNVYEGIIETEVDMLKVQDAKVFNDLDNGGHTYFFNMDFDARVESTNLKKLRRSTAINNLFSYDKPSFDLYKFLPWAITMLAILFN